jgi:hypothetical protein
MNYRAVAAIFLELVELPKTEDRTAEKAVRMVVTVGTAAL